MTPDFAPLKAEIECAPLRCKKRGMLTPRGVTTEALFGQYVVDSQPDEGLPLT